MVNVIFVAPFYMQATNQFIEGAVGLPGVRLALIGQDPLNRLPEAIASRLTYFHRIDNCLDPKCLFEGVRHVESKMGKCDRLIGTLEQGQIPMAIVREMAGIAGMPSEIARNFRDKSRMKDILRANNVPCARHCLATSANEALDFVQKVGFPIIVKPQDGAGSKNTHRIESLTELKKQIHRAEPTRQNPMMIEEFVLGNEHTFEGVFIQGRLVWHSLTRYFPTPLEALKNPWIQWCILLPREIDHPYFDDIRKIAIQANLALGMRTGLSHLEWFRRTDGSIAVSEVGARPPGGQLTSITGYAHDFDIHRAWARLMIYDEFEPPVRAYATGAVFVRGQGEGRVKAIRGWQTLQRELGSMIVEHRLPKVGQPANNSYEGEGYILLRHPVTSVVEKALDRVINTIRIELG